MPKAVPFTPEVIAELRHRVIAHNTAVDAMVQAPRGAVPVKLGPMKGLYKKYYGGKDNPHAHALSQIDEHLARMRGEPLAKARPPQEQFEEGEHPRGQGGRFRPAGGGSPAAPPREVVHTHYHSGEVQVIPETRYSVFGPPIAGAAGVAYGALGGATATFHGTPVDRAITGALSWGGKHVGRAASHILVTPAIHAGNMITRTAAGRINRAFGTKIPRPGPQAASALAGRVAELAGKGGRHLGRGVGIAQGFAFAAPAAMARRAITGAIGGSPKARLLSMASGALAGAIFPGALFYAPSFHRTAQSVGPYLDTRYPRRVLKIADLLDDPQVLAKRAELLDGDLAKASLGNLLGALGGAARGLAPRARRLLTSLRPRGIAGASGTVFGPGVSPAMRSAETVYGAAGAKYRPNRGFTVGPMRGTRAAAIGTHVAGLGILGAGGGALAGLGAGYGFEQLHPRGAKGRFARKGAQTGAKIGAAIGLTGGLVAGILAARGGHTALLAQAVERLGSEHAAMRDAAELHAREAHANAFMNAQTGASKIKPMPPSGGLAHIHVRNELESKAGAAFDLGVGRAIKGGPQSWYYHQIDEAFERNVLPQLRAVADVDKGKRLPVLGLDGRAVQGDLLANLDPEKLNASQRKIWDSAVAKRHKAVEDVQSVYAARQARANALSTQLTDMKAEKARIQKDLDFVPRRALELDQGDSTLRQIVSFAKNTLGHEIKATKKQDALEELRQVMPGWEANANTRLNEIEAATGRGGSLHEEISSARQAEADDLAESERMAIANPFHTSRGKQYFPPLPKLSDARAAAVVASSRSFVRESEGHAAEARGHLDNLVTHQQAALNEQIPTQGVLARFGHWAMPIVAGHMSRASEDYVTLISAHRGNLKGLMKQAYDWLHANKNPRTAYGSIKAISGGAASYGRRAGAFGLRNWKTISSGIGLASAAGVLDVTAPWKSIIKPSRGGRPKGFKIEHELPDPIRRPNEALLGISYRDKEGQQRFLQGIHITGADGRHAIIPFNAKVDQVKATIMNRDNQGGGNRPRADPVEVKDQAAVHTAINVLRSQNAITRVGPSGMEFTRRTGGNPSPAVNEVNDGFYKNNVSFMEQPHLMGKTTNQPDRYFRSLKNLFEGGNTELMDLRDTASMLIGGYGRKRGIFANKNGAYVTKGSGTVDNGKITRELVAQVSSPIGHTPQNDEEYRQLRRALWVVTNHYGLSDGQKTSIENALEQAYTKATAQTPPTVAAAATIGGAASRAGGPERSGALQDRMLNEVPEYMRPPGAKSDREFREFIHALYEVEAKKHRDYAAKNEPNVTEDELHDRAAKGVDNFIEGVIAGHNSRNRKEAAAPIGDLRKFQQAVPAIGGAHKRKGPGFGAEVRRATAPAHALSQLGAYGIGQAALDVGEHLGARFLPGGGILRSGLRFAAASGLNLAGASAGGFGGNAIGRRLGDHSNAPKQGLAESGVRTAGGLVGQIYGGKLGAKLAGPAVDRFAARAAPAIGGAAERLGLKAAGGAVRAGAGRVAGAVTRAATAGLGERFGGWVGGALGTGIGGAAGTVAEPGGGTAAGGWGGKIAGTAIGAGIGYLADEGVGILYRHLSRYGSHVPHMAATHLGVPAETRARHGSAYA